MSTNRGSLDSPGFSLVEVLMATVLLTVAAGALLHNLAISYRHYDVARDDWRASLQLWNQAARSRAGLERTPAEPLRPVPGGLPLWKTNLTIEASGRQITWEVWHAKP